MLAFVACRLLLYQACGIMPEKVVNEMRIGIPADAILPQYTGTDVFVRSIDENDDACCMCIGLSNNTFWFFGEDCVGKLPLRIVISDVEYDGVSYTLYGKNIMDYLQ